MKGLLINKDIFEERLAYDDIFTEYFNAFLLLPAFAKIVQYDSISGAFHDVLTDQASWQLQPSEDPENESKKKEKVMNWVKSERLPLFLNTRLYLEFKLCRLLLRKLRDSRSTARASSRGLGGYSRTTGSTPISPTAPRPSSHVSNHSWPGVPMRNCGRRPLGSATSLPGMLLLGMDTDRDNGFAKALNGLGELEFVDDREKNKVSLCTLAQEKDNRKVEVNKEDKLDSSETTGQQAVDECHVLGQDESEGEGGEDDLSAVMEFNDDADLDEADIKSIASRHNITLEELKEHTLGSLRGMSLFRSFLEDTVGIHLYNFWLDAEHYKDSLVFDSEDTVRQLRSQLFREILDKYKNHLTPDAKGQIERALYHGGVTQDLFTRTQYDALRRMRSYWVPRFLVHLERTEEFGDSYFTYVSPREKPPSSLFPTLTLAHSLPPLGDWCRDIVRSRKWDRDLLIKDKRNKSARKRPGSPQGVSNDPFLDALRAEKDAGCPFKRYLQSIKKDTLLLARLSFWLDISDYYEAEWRARDRYLSRCNAWNIFNTYIAPGARLGIRFQDKERKRIEKLLHSAEELPLDLFKPSEEFVVNELRIVWEDFKDFDRQRYQKPSRDAMEQYPEYEKGVSGAKDLGHYYSPTTGRWVKRHPGSSPSERGRRLYTSLAMAEEIDADRSLSSSPKRAPLIPSPVRGKKQFRGAAKPKKKTKAGKNVTFDNKKKAATDSDDEEDSMDAEVSKPGKPPPLPPPPDFVDVVENKGTMSAFKQYVQNMEGRQAMNQLMMYLEIEQYYSILPAKKMQKSQQATHIYKTYFDSSSRRCVSLPSLLVASVESERPSSPVMAEAQQAVLNDIKNYFKTFFKTAQDAGFKREVTPNTPGQFSKADTFESSQSFLQFYRKRSKKTKNTGRIAPSKEDKEEFKRVLQSTHGRLPVKLEYFRRYLQTHGDPDGFSKLENDFFFYLEVQKFKELFSYMDDASVNKKVETIIECFLDSATPPWLQIDIGTELASRTIHKAQVFLSSKRVPKDPRDPGLFDEAQSILFKELLPFWAGFCKQYSTPKPDEQGGVKLPPTKHEKALHKRYQEFVKYQTVTDTLVLPPVAPTHGQSKTEVSFSVSDGMRWKERKDIDTISVTSSVDSGMVAGVRKESTINGSVQHIEVGS
ncbi:uncharacterized protein LOC116620845 isoform X2 [Nematostella vectensis]|uniref:uncharacterized protein LOC116620845 isoform X2 n=1 Tax=Nematostella vectensis TaxID=45351 RepID=UPI00207724CC|nr:uncharacterized protein LOC116620845 isoform X2 [Nematostella vectensis]